MTDNQIMNVLLECMTEANVRQSGMEEMKALVNVTVKMVNAMAMVNNTKSNDKEEMEVFDETYPSAYEHLPVDWASVKKDTPCVVYSKHQPAEKIYRYFANCMGGKPWFYRFGVNSKLSDGSLESGWDAARLATDEEKREMFKDE